MVDRRDDYRENFIIDEDDVKEADELQREEYYENSFGVFKKKSGPPLVAGGVILAVLVIILVIVLTKPKNVVDPAGLQSLETRLQQLEKKLATIGVMDQTIERLGKQEQDFIQLGEKLSLFESTVTTQIDQIIRELGVLHQKISQKPASATPPPKTAGKKQAAASKKAEPPNGFHLVQTGDTLYRISRKYGLSVDQLRSYNNLAPNAAIYPGQKLKLSPNG